MLTTNITYYAGSSARMIAASLTASATQVSVITSVVLFTITLSGVDSYLCCYYCLFPLAAATAAMQWEHHLYETVLPQ